jgi:2,4'-dihydroxyacetophenone dioxygenase
MLVDRFAARSLDLDGDVASWIPQAEGVWFRPLLLAVSSGYYIDRLRVRAAGALSRHRHNGPVHALTLRESARQSCGLQRRDWQA